ncbi:formate/nitrite transporter family protein [Georgenia sp. SYP-B2076]|uniref:formate/nitrite transporter family protein n=1 Tax=Georgenia sp. SYP-B2076 TaxID=2495881 RepID=UPI000F8D8176|nr:formate/nitrite transporter family protein [Georgenia sp. SYP-B2076]
MLSLPQTLELHGDLAVHKVELARTPARHLLSAALAGAYVGVGVLLMLAAAGPLRAAGSPWAPTVQGAVFGIALVLVVFAGGELATSAMMILAQGTMLRRVAPGAAARALGLTVGGNLLGGAALGLLVHLSGVLAPSTAGGQMLAWYVEHKAAASTGELFVRGVLCNMLVCLAIWCANRMSSEGARIAVIAWCLFAFVSLGFEHVVANMTTFTLALLAGADAATWGEAARNLVVVGLGNLVGGAVLVGGAYVAVGRDDRVPARPWRTVEHSGQPSHERV